MAEKKEAQAAASYIVTFFNDVENLSWQSANYMNLLIASKAKYSKEELKDGSSNIEMEDQQSLVSITQGLRAAIFRTYTKIMAMEDMLKLPISTLKTLTDLYKKLSEQIAPVMTDVESYNIEMNKIFITGVGKDLLLNSQDIMSGLVS